jgi:hypothetical protein
MKRRIAAALLAFVFHAAAGVTCNRGAGTLPCAAHPAVYTVSCAASTGVLAEVQQAVDDAHRGDTIRLQAGCRWSTSSSSYLWLDFMPPGTSGNVVITTTEEDKLPAPGTRITPAYWPLLPQFSIASSSGPAIAIAGGFEGRSSKRTPGVAPRYWELRGLGFIQENPDPNSAQTITNGFFRLGGAGITFSKAAETVGLVNFAWSSLVVSNGVATATTMNTAGSVHYMLPGDKVRLAGFLNTPALNGIKTVLSATTYTFTFSAPDLPNGTYTEPAMHFIYPADRTQVPRDIVIDRVVTRNNGLSRMTREMYLNSSDTTVKNSWFSAARDTGADSQVILFGPAAGERVTLENNYMGALTSENVLLGGSAVTLPEFTSDHTVRFNYFSHPPLQGRQRTWTLLKADADPLILKGRPVRPSVANGYAYIAMNTGNLGTTEPAWCTAANCEVTEQGVSNPVTWRRWVGSGVCAWCIKNNFEIKSTRNIDVRHNVFEYMWPDGQNYAINLKSTAESLYPNYWNLGPPTRRGTVDVAANGTTVTVASGDNFGTQLNTNTVITVSIDPATDVMTVTAGYGTYLTNNFRFGFFGAAAPAPAAANTTYFVRYVSSGKFKISTTPNDSGVVDFQSPGTARGFIQEVHGKVIRIGGIFYEVQSFDAANRLTLVSPGTGGPLSGQPYHMGADPAYRFIQDAITENINLTHNIVRNVSASVTLVAGGTNRTWENTLNIRFRYNLIENNDPVFWTRATGETYASATSTTALFGMPFPSGTVIENNTVIMNGTGNGIFNDPSIGKVANDTVIRNNIFTRPMNAAVYGNHLGLTRDYCGGAATCPLSQWDRNIFAGANLSTFTSPGLAVNLCPARSGCTTPDYGAVFRNFAARQWDVKNTSAFKRASTDGSDYGADFSQLPRIVGLTANATDRLVVFRYSVTQPISHIPCVAEVSDSVEFATYAGEGGNPGSYPRHDSDAFDGYPGTPMHRTLIVGASAPLLPDKKYHYRLSCGGDVQSGTFTTLPAKSGQTTVHIARPGASSMVWGYAYSRTAGTITDGAAASCADNACTATGQRGRVLYYRIGSGPVETYLVP